MNTTTELLKLIDSAPPAEPGHLLHSSIRLKVNELLYAEMLRGKLRAMMDAEGQKVLDRAYRGRESK